MAKIKKAMKGGSKVSKGKKGKKLLESDQVRLAPLLQPVPHHARRRARHASPSGLPPAMPNASSAPTAVQP